MNWLHYLLEANLYLGVFYIGYYLFLSRETYYTLNRVYLLFSCIASFALPVLQLGILKPVEQPITAVNFTFTPQAAVFTPVQGVIEATPAFTWQDALIYGYILGAAILLTVLLIKLYSLLKLTRSQNPGADGKYKLVYIDQSATAFSFFNYLFIGTKVEGSETIIRHELVHIRQKHSFDIIFIELLKIVNWFNPFIYLLQYSLKTIHEYIADEKTAIAENDSLAYSSFLVNNAYGLGGSSITHSFFNYNLLKKRIIMLHQKRSGSLARLKYLVAVPICAALLCASTLAFSKSYGWVDIGPHRIDKNNKSPQVVEPKRSLLVRQNGLSYLTDKFSYKRADGSTRVYTGYNISNKDVVDLAKKGIQIDVLYDAKVETGDAKKLPSVRDNDTAKHIAPPPPPAPPVGAAKVDRRPPPPPPAPPVTYTTKGYKYQEIGYVVNGKTDFRVIIFDKTGDPQSYFKNKASTADIKLLKDKYGYTFPNMEIYTKMPPPPPAAGKLTHKAAAVRFSPPVVVPDAPKGKITSDAPVAPKGKIASPVIVPDAPDAPKGKIEVDHRPPPPPPAGAIINDVPGNAPKNNVPYKSIVYVPSKTEPSVQMPLIVVNGNIYHPKETLKKGGSIYFSADSVIGHSPDDENQKKKWGTLAANGVVELFGKQPTVTVSN